MSKQHPGASPLGQRLDRAGETVADLTRGKPEVTDEEKAKRKMGKKKKKRGKR